jgi:hypothetical protein
MNRRVTSEADGRVHLPGIDTHDSQSLCGHCWPDGNVVETKDVADCKMCLRALDEVLAIARCRSLRSRGAR